MSDTTETLCFGFLVFWSLLLLSASSEKGVVFAEYVFLLVKS
jgi:hypothetical protein